MMHWSNIFIRGISNVQGLGFSIIQLYTDNKPDYLLYYCLCAAYSLELVPLLYYDGGINMCLKKRGGVLLLKHRTKLLAKYKLNIQASF